MSAVEFHLSEPVLRDYAADQLTDVDAWSVEAHLQRCRACQDRIVLRGPVADAVASARMSLSAQLDANQLSPNAVSPDPVSPGSATARPGWWRRAVVLIGFGPAARAAWLVSLAITLALTFALAIKPMVIEPWVLLLLAPVLPVLAVVVSYGPHTDPLHELVAASPYGGLRIVLWRTLSTLAVSVPVVVGSGVVAGIGSPLMWLLPCLALTCLTLALGSVLEPARAGAVVAAAWALAVLAPVGEATLIAPRTAGGWLLVAAVAGALTFVRRDRMGRGMSR